MSDALQDAILATVDPTRAPPPAAPADVAQPPEDPLTGAIRQVVSDGAQAQDFDTKIAAMRATHSTLSPEHAVEAGKLAAVTGLDPSYVADNLDTIRPQVTQDQLARALRDKPCVARLMRSAEKAAIVKDDVANLGALEWLFTGRWDKVAEGGIFGYSMTTPPALARAMGQGIDEQRIALLSARQMAGTASPAEMTELDSLEASAQRNLVSDAEAGFLGAAKHHLAESFVGGARMLPYIAGNFAARAAGGLVGAVAGPAGATAGQYGAGAAFDFYQQVGPLYRSLKKLGVLTDNEARGYAVATAGAMSLLTAGLAGKMIGALPPVKAALEKIAGQTVTQALTERTVRGAITGAAKQYGEHVGAGAALMVAQSAANATAAQVALATHGEKFDAAPIVRAAGDAAQRAVTDLALLSAWGPGRGLLRNLGERSQLRADAAEIAGVAQAAEASKAVERDPRVVDALAQGKLYYADAPGWDAYWTAQGLAPRDVAAKLLADGGKAYDEARAASGAFAVPASKLAELVRTAHGKAAQELFRAKPDGLSIAEAKRHDAVLEQRLKDLDADAQIKTDAEQIHALEKAKALDAGEHESVADAYATMRVSNLKHYMAATGRGTLPEWYQRVGDLQIVRGAEAAPPKVQAAIVAAHAVATVPPRPVEAPPAAAAGTTGKRTGQVITPQRPGGEPVRYDVIEAADLVPSHNPQTFDPHPDYPPGVQERNYLGQPEEQMKVVQGGQHLNPAFLLADTPSPLDGPPLVTAGAKRLVLGGNGRSMMIRRGFHDQATREGYRQALLAKAESFGIPLDEVQKLTAPVLVRVVEGLSDAADKGELTAAVRRFNEGMTQQLSPRARAIAEAKTLTPETLESIGALLNDAGDSSLRDVMRERPGDVVAILRRDGVINHQNQTQWLQGGELTDEGKDRIEGMFLGRVFGTEARLSATAPSLTNKIERTAPFLMRVAGINPALDETQTVRDAVDLLNEAKKRAIPLGDLLQQGTLFGDGPKNDAAAAAMARLIDKSTPTALAARFKAWAGRAGVDPRQLGMFDTAPTLEGARASLFGGKEGSGTLFQDEAGRWQLHLSTDPNAITQEMAPLGIARVGVPSKIDRAGHDFAARDPLAQTQEMPVLEGLDRLEQTRKDEARGFIEFHPTGGGEPVRATIHLLNGDRSTLAHETMHFFFESLSRIASAADAPEGVRDDYAKLLDFAGYGSHQERQALTAERVMLASKAERAPVEQARLNDLVAREERVTHAWEQYLAEGKAPAKELRGVFRRFKLWMIGIYRGISGPAGQFQNAFGQELPALSDDVRKVFGRLLGAQDGLKAANEDVAGLPDEVMGKLQPGERAQVDEAAATAAERGEQEVVRSLAEDDRGETARFLRDERERIRAEVTAETDQEPGYRALAALRSGEGAQVGIDGKPLRLSKPLTAPEFARDPRLRGIWATEGVGLEPDQMAGVLGFDDGRTLLETLRDQEPRDQRIERLTADKLQEQYGGLVSEAQKVAAAALAATHEDAAARKVIWEWRAIYRAMGKEPPALDLAQVRYTAERLVAEKRIDELRPERHLASERAAAQRAYDLARTGALDKAAAEKESQILSRELWRAAKNAREIADAAREKIEGTASDKWRATLGKADPLLRDLHDDLLAAVGLGEERGVRGKIDDALASLSPGEIGFDVQSIRDVLAQRPGWDGLTIGEALDVRDAVKSLRHIARAINEVTIEGQKRDRAEVIAQIGEDAARLPDMGKMLADKTQRTAFQRALRAIQAGDANLLEPEVLFEFLGPTAHKVIWDAYLAGRALKDHLSKTVLDFFAKRWEEMPQAMRDRRYEPIADLDRTLPIPEDVAQAGPRSRQWLWMVALNMGNEGNRERLLGGYGWEEAHVLDVLRQHLDKSEWDFVQSIWSLADKELWPLLAEKEEQRTGLVPEKVKATPIETPHGTYEGGYFPAKYDPRPGQSRLGARQAEAGLAAASTTYGQTSTAKGHTKKRASTYSDTINLQWEVVPSHLAQVIHDLAFDQVTRETARLINDRGMQQILAQRLGEERAMQPNAWLKVVASAQADAVPQHLQTFMANTLGGMRSRAALGAMGWSLSVSMAQLTHPFIAAAAGEVSLRHLLPVLGQTLAKWGDLRTDGLANSAELLHRSGHFAEKLREEIGDVGAQGAAAGPLETVRRTAWSFLEAVDALTSTIIFQARKRQGLAEGLDLDAANKTADRAVRSMMPAHDMAEEPSILRDRRGVGALLMFHGFFSKLYNQTRRMAHEPYLAWNDPTESKASAAAKTAAAAGRALAMIGVASLGGEFLAGHGAEDDETWGQWLARKALAAPFGMIPFASNIAEPVADKLVTDRVRQVSVRSAPMLSVIQQVVDTIGNLTNENREGSKKAWDLVELALTGAKMPARQPRRTGEFLTDWLWTGDARPQDASDVASGVFYGHRDHQPATPFAPGMH